MVDKRRYFVDERIGCVAVRDRNLTDPDYSGLHPDTPGVVEYWQGSCPVITCSECGQQRSTGWEVDRDDVDAAHRRCHSLNATERHATDIESNDNGHS